MDKTILSENIENNRQEVQYMTSKEYIASLNEIFSELPTYKLRYFYAFITAKLGC